MASMTVDEVIEQIREVLSPLTERFALLVEAGLDLRAISNAKIDRVIEAGAEAWALALVNPADNTASFKGTQLLRAAFGKDVRPPAEFWRTPLGQLLVARGAFPSGSASRTEAAAVLGMTWQGITKRVERGRLIAPEGEPTKILRDSLMAEWHHANRDERYAQMQELASIGPLDLGDDLINWELPAE